MQLTLVTGPLVPHVDLFPWLNTKVKVHISVWTIRENPKIHSSYLSDSGDTFLPLIWGLFYSDCSENIYEITNCSLLNQSMIYHEQLVNHSCSSVLLNCTSHPEMEHRLAATCISTLRGIVGDFAFSNATFLSSRNLTSPSEEYF